MRLLLSAVLLFGFSTAGFSLDKKVSLVDLQNKYDITTGDLKDVPKTDDGFCRVGFHVQSRRFFSNDRDARLFCDDLGGFSRYGDLCLVRRYSDGFYGSSFSYVGFGSGRSFFDVLDLVRGFLRDAGLLNVLFNLDVQFDGVRGC